MIMRRRPLCRMASLLRIDQIAPTAFLSAAIGSLIDRLRKALPWRPVSAVGCEMYLRRVTANSDLARRGVRGWESLNRVERVLACRRIDRPRVPGFAASTRLDQQ